MQLRYGVARRALPRPAPYREHAGRSGASLGDLKARMGHDSARAAMIYQHATAAADRAIADALNERIEASGKDSRDRPDDDDGPGGGLVPAG